MTLSPVIEWRGCYARHRKQMHILWPLRSEESALLLF